MNDSYYSMLALDLGIGIEVLFISTLIHIFPVLTNEKKNEQNHKQTKNQTKQTNQCEKKESAQLLISEDYKKVVLLTSET